MLLWQKLLAQTLAGLKDATRSFEQAAQQGQAYGTHPYPSEEGNDLQCVDRQVSTSPFAPFKGGVLE